MSFLWVAFSGWAAVLLLGAGISMPCLARCLRWSNLSPHYCLGLLMLMAATLHASIPMSFVGVGRLNMTGLLLATAALVLMIWQAGLGLALCTAQGTQRSKVKRMHFGTMTIVVVLVIAHIAVNRS